MCSDDEPPLFCFQPSHELKLGGDEEARRLARENLSYFSVIAAPATGPRALVTLGFDEHLHEQIRGREHPIYFVGASTAALRFSALIAGSSEGQSRSRKLLETYCAMHYSFGDSPKVLTPMMEEFYRNVAPEHLVEKIVGHPSHHMAIMVAALHPCYHNAPDFVLRGVLYGFCAANAVVPSCLRLLYRRICFHTGPPPPLEPQPGLEFVPLTSANFYDVLRATTCIPFVSERCTHIHGLGPGLYFDGALSDYHLNLRAQRGHAMLFLGDEAHGCIKQTVFDTLVPWRSAPAAFFERCSVVCPTPAFTAQLPDKRLPLTWDFFDRHYVRNPELRRANWRAAFRLSCAHWPKCLASIMPPSAGGMGDEGNRLGSEAGEAGSEAADDAKPVFTKPVYKAPTQARTRKGGLQRHRAEGGTEEAEEEEEGMAGPTCRHQTGAAAGVGAATPVPARSGRGRAPGVAVKTPQLRSVHSKRTQKAQGKAGSGGSTSKRSAATIGAAGARQAKRR